MNRPRKYAAMSTRELLVCAALGTLGAVVLAPSIWAFAVLGVAVPVLYPLLAGVSTCAPTITQMILRRPGVALVTCLTMAFATLPVSPNGAAGLQSLAIVGLALELPFALGGYRRWGAWRWYVASGLLGLFTVTATWVTLDLGSLRPALAYAICATTVGSYLTWTAIGRAFGHRLQAAGVGVIAA
ncbi:MAG: ECF transporter S component [Aeromicrobium sp.]|uniref:ECF transporter S component n=1 Tax=Aeromicrobium sp. TaxID=1871063 RepID=UPI0039E43397